ncbi:MAG: hypothetical protein HKL99_12875 [Burkholderiales bacterium]|nr:hypothetical protein [Burkholderiales bacterium]
MRQLSTPSNNARRVNQRNGAAETHIANSGREISEAQAPAPIFAGAAIIYASLICNAWQTGDVARSKENWSALLYSFD